MVLSFERLLSRTPFRQGLRPIIYGLAFDRSIEYRVDALSVGISYNRKACIQLIAGRFLPCVFLNGAAWRIILRPLRHNHFTKLKSADAN